MKKNLKNCLWMALTAIILLVLLGIVIGTYNVPHFLAFKRSLSVPPSVIVHAPFDGEKHPTGSIISSRSTSTSMYPIERVELWIDGEMVEKKTPTDNDQNEMTTMHVTIPVNITEGIHLLYWRVVDHKGQIGQSPPITLIGTERLGGDETTTITAEEGQTLQDIAEEAGGEPDVLVKSNPDLGLDELPAGTRVTVPKPNPPGEQQPPQGGDIIVDPPEGGSIIVTNPLPLANQFIDLGPLLSVFASNFPAAPSSLEAGFENCSVQLNWVDNADNEQAYEVWMKPGAGLPRLVSTLQPRQGTGEASYVFESPSFGIYGFWVEAVNGLGRQPSQVTWLFIDDSTCQGQWADGLDVEIVDLDTGGFSGMLYCYLSFEGNTNNRVPELGYLNDLDTNPTNGNILDLVGRGNIYLVPIPEDKELSISGKCLGHLGNDVIELGTLEESIPEIQWNGMYLEAEVGNMKLGYRIQPHGLEQPSGFYQYVDDDLPVPEVISVTAMSDRDPLKRSRLARNVNLSWTWEGISEEITSFAIAFDDAMMFRFVGNELRSLDIVLPTSCGGNYRFAVAAMAKEGARSDYSSWHEYRQPPCDYYAEVIFDTFVITDFDDNENLPRDLDCDVAELGFEITVSSVNQVWRNFDGGLRWGYYGTEAHCNTTYHFTQFPFNKGSPGRRDSFTVLIEPESSSIDIHLRFLDLDNFIVAWDSDHLCQYNRNLAMPLDQWAGYYQSFSEVCQEAYNDEQDGTVTINYRVKGFRTPYSQ